MKKILLSALLTLCLVFTLMPMTVYAVVTPSVTVGGVTLTYTEIPVYATTNSSGVVTTDGATAGNYNIKFENTTLTLRNAKISYNSNTAIQKNGDLTIVADGGSSVVESGAGNPTIFADNLTLEGSGTLTVTSERNTAVYVDDSLNVQGDISLTAVGGPASGQIGGPALYSNNNLVIQGNATVIAMGGASSIGNGSLTGSAGIWGIRTVLIQGNASITAVGGDTTATGYSSGILSGSEYSTGSITIGGSTKVVAVGGKSNTASYGLYASSTGAITYNGGLLVARGGENTSTSLAMNKAATGDALTSAEVTNNNGTSNYCVISPKTNETADYYLVASRVSSSTGNISGHITWDENNNLILNNTVIIGDSLALTMPEGNTLNLSGFNAVLGGDSGGSSYGLSWGNYNNGNIITGDGSLVAIGGSANGGPSVGIGNVSTISTTGRITAIGGSSSNSSSHGVRTYPTTNITTIITGSGVALAGILGEGGDAWSFSSAPSTSGLATTGAYNGKVMTWRPVSTINISTITGVTPPVAGAVPVTSITETDQYTGTVTWSGNPGTFDYSTVYTATITLLPKTDYTLTGITADFFTVTGADTVTNGAASGVVTAVFPETTAAPPSGGGGGGGGGGSGAASTLVTKIDTGGTVTGTNVDNLVKEGKTLTVEGKAGETLVFDTEALKNISGQTKDTVKVEIKDISSDYINDHPGRLVVSLNVTAGDQRITNFGNGVATISLPYDLKEGERAEDVTVWYLQEDGTMTEVPCTYDPITKLATFQVNHFSLYVVGTADISLWINPFSDVRETSWYYDAVRYVSANGLMNGIYENTFRPTGETSRAMIVTILWRMENQPSAEKEITFTDVAKEKYYYDAVAWASENGIVSGYSEKRFGPEDSITREQLAVILHNYAVSKGIDTESTADLAGFVDSTTIHDWAKDAMMWANGEGLINGVGNNKLNPLGSAERCQVAAILQRFILNSAE